LAQAPTLGSKDAEGDNDDKMVPWVPWRREAKKTPTLLQLRVPPAMAPGTSTPMVWRSKMGRGAVKQSSRGAGWEKERRGSAREGRQSIKEAGGEEKSYIE